MPYLNIDINLEPNTEGTPEFTIDKMTDPTKKRKSKPTIDITQDPTAVISSSSHALLGFFLILFIIYTIFTD